MKPTGVIRRVDDLGRVVIPKEFRRELKIKEGNALEVFTEGDFICFKRYFPLCEFCNENEGVHKIGARVICDNCLGQLQSAEVEDTH